MNVFLSSEEKTIEPAQSGGKVHAVSLIPPREKTVALLLEAAENEEQKRRRMVWFHNAVGGTIFFAYAALLVTFCLDSLFFHLGPSIANRLVHISVVIMVVNGAFQMGTRYFSDARVQKRKEVTAALLQFPDAPRGLLAFIDALHVPHTPEWKSLLFPRLTELLWNLSSTDASLSLDDTRRATLRDTLEQAYPIMANGRRKIRYAGYFDDVTTDLAVAVMKTLAGLGDTKSEKVLRKIIKAEAITPNETVVRDAAREYLPVLLQKIKEAEKVQEKLHECFGEFLRDPQTVRDEFLNTLSAEKAKVALVEFIHKEQHSARLFISFFSGTFVLMGLVMLLSCLSFHVGLKHIFAPLFMSLSLIALGIDFHFRFAVKGSLNKEGRIIVDVLNRRTESESDLRLIPLFLLFTSDGGFFNDRYSNDAAKKSLARLLPLLQPGDAALVPPDQRATLRAWLKIPRNKKRTGSGSQTLTIAALDALAAVGDTKALPAAQKIARQTLRGNYHEAELHEAALRCVEALQARKGSRA